MPFFRPARRLIQGQGGSTLVELLVAMPLAVLLLGLALQALADAGKRQQELERRTTALNHGQLGLERITREVRQADWAFFRSSSVVDLGVKVRPSPATSAVDRLVRYDCSGPACVRLEGPAVAFPPPAAPLFERSYEVVGSAHDRRRGRVVDHDAFRPRRIDAATAQPVVDFVEPDTLLIRLKLAVEGRRHPLELQDGVTLRNRSRFR